MSSASSDLLISSTDAALAIHLVKAGQGLEGRAGQWAKANGFSGKSGQLLIVPDEKGAAAEALFGIGSDFDPFSVRSLTPRLPQGDWKLEGVTGDALGKAALAFALGGYVFDRYKTRERPLARLVVEGLDLTETLNIAAAAQLAREMVDTPAQDMGPLQLETIAREIAEGHGASLKVTTGEQLLEDNYPAVHTVGRAAVPDRAPRVLEIGWKLDQKNLPLIALVGKGVVFDTGGLNLKGGVGMRNMKKDMGGSAHALALGRLIMQADLPVRLVVLVAAVENAVAGDAFRPGDILNTRKGLTIENGNTDAEGRLILADILTRASEHAPDLTLDFATLTGAARIALGPQLPPLYTDDEALAEGILKAGKAVGDPLWRMPLWQPYAASLDSEIADVRNDSAGWAQAGSVTAALFLQKFAPTTGAWAHMDIFAWNPRARPGYAEGAECQAIRACYNYLTERYGK